MKLTDTLIRAAKNTDKVQKLTDGGGLYLYIGVTGGKLWRMAYRFDEKQKSLSFGAYPAVSLKAARQKRDEAKELIANGIDPGEHKAAVKASAKAETKNTYEIVAREWYAKQSPTWAKNTAYCVLTRQEKDIFPHIGTMAINTISASELLAAIRRIEARGAIDTAHRALQECSKIFRYGIATGRCERDTAADLKGALQPAVAKSRATITDTVAIGQLLRTIDTFPNHLIRGALQMLAYVFTRPGELRRAEWLEIDLDAAEWRIPAEKMKMRVTHIVPLPRQVIKLLRDIRQYAGHSIFVFPSYNSTKPLGELTLVTAIRRLGYGADEMTAHGFRHMASTILNEKQYPADWIERQLAHGGQGVRAHYNYAQYLPERRKMMQEYADYLDGLRATKD